MESATFHGAIGSLPMQRLFSTAKAHLLREPHRSIRDGVVTACGIVVVLTRDYLRLFAWRS